MKECRCLVFTEQEVARAVLERRRKRREPLPTGTVLGVSHEDGRGALHTTLTVIDDYGERTPLAIAEEELAAALVAWCMDRKIPLPAEADKFLHLINGALSLMITLNFNKPPRMVTEAVGRQTQPRRVPLPAA